MTDLAKLELRIESRGAERATAALNKFTKRGKRAADTARRMGQSSTRAERGVNRLGRSMQRLGRSTKVAGAGAAGLGRTLGLLGGAFVGLRVLRSVTSTLVEFGDTMAAVQGIAVDATASFAVQGAQMAKLTKQTLALGASTRFSAKEVGEGQLFLARAGFGLNDILDALPATLDLAAAGVVDLGVAADIASNVLAQFNLSASEMVRVSDVLVTATVRSNTTLTQLAEALKLVGPVAASVNQSLELTAATIGILGNAGIQGSMAGTQLRGVIAKLLDPTSGAQKVMQSLADTLGVAANEFDISKKSADGMTAPLLRILDLFGEAGTTASEFFQIFGLRQATGAIVLTKFRDELRALFEEEKKAKGEAKRLAAIMEDTLGGAFRRLAAATEGLKLSIGAAGLGSSMRDFIELLVDSIRILAGADGALKKSSRTAKVLAAVIAGLATAFGVLLVGAIGVAVGTLITFAGSTVGAVALAVGGLIASFQLLKNETFTLGGVTGTVGDAFVVVWEEATKRVAAAFRVFSTIFGAFFDALKDLTTKMFAQFNQAFIVPVQRAMRLMGISWGSVLDAMLAATVSFVDQSARAFETMFNFLGRRMERLTKALKAFSSFDIAAPLKGVANIKEAFGEFLDPGTLGADLGLSVLSASTSKKLSVAVSSAAKQIKNLLEASFGSDFIDDLDLTLGKGFFDKIFDDFEKASESTRLKQVAATVAASIGLAVEAIFGKMSLVTDGQKQAEAKAFLAQIQDEIEGLEAAAKAASRQEIIDLQSLEEAKNLVLDLQFALDTVFLTDNELRKLQALEQYKTALEVTTLTIEEQKLLVDEFDEGLDRLFELERIERFSSAIADTLGNGFRDAILQAQSLSDVVESVGKEITAIVFDTLVTDPLKDSLRSGLATVLGGGGEKGKSGGDLALIASNNTLNASLLLLNASVITLTAATTASAGAGAVSGIAGALGSAGAGAAGADGASAMGNVFGFKSGAAFGGGQGLAANVGDMLTNGPVAFPIGVAGEKGAEAIMPARRFGGGFAVRGLLDGGAFDLPLTRDSNGNLSADLSGIKSRGFALGGAFGGRDAPLALNPGVSGGAAQTSAVGVDSGGGGAIVVSNTFNFPNSNPDAFRKSQRAIEDDLSRVMNNAGRRRK